MLQALQFAIIASIVVSRMVIGPGWGPLPLLALGPAVAAATAAVLYTWPHACYSLSAARLAPLTV
jgi:hypothetical protein